MSSPILMPPLSYEEMDPVLKQACYLMWVDMLNSKTEDGKADMRAINIAGQEICEMTGIKDIIRAVAVDGELRPPPAWPGVDIVPVGGGPGILTCEVRTVHPEAGKLKVKIALSRQGKKFEGNQIGEALERGKFELRQLIQR